jgi:trehalose 6-phosphate phosphatase
VADVDAIIAALTARPAQTALLADFDGSLSTIVTRAEDARPIPGVVEVLERLAARLGRVGIVSGRPVRYLVDHIPARGITYTGLYGMEHVVDGRRTVDPRVEPYLPDVARALAEITTRVPAELVEPKSGISVTLHWRPDPARADEIVAAAADIAPRYGLAQLRTRMAVELRPPVPIDKGEAVRAQIEGFATAAFAGDDTGDLPAFAALTAAVDEGTLGRAVRIGVRSAEAPPELVAATDVMVDGAAGLLALLSRLADEIA